MAIPILGDLIDGVKDLVSEVVVDKDKRDQVNLELKKLEDQAQARLDAQVAGQIEINKVEAASGSVFVAGWRPAIGWVGALALLWAFVLGPAVQWLGQMFGHPIAIPDPNFSELMPLIFAILGIGGMRTFEKVKGVSTNDYSNGKTASPQTETEVTLASGDTISTKTTPPPVPVSVVAAPAKRKKWSL